MGETEFPPSLQKLKTFPDPRDNFHWPKGRPDYVKQMQLGPEHIPALIEIARQWPPPADSVEGPALWAPVHAWRALAQLRALRAIAPLLKMLDRLDEADDDWYMEEFPDVFALIGPESVSPLAAYLADPSHRLYPRIAVANGLARVAKRHTETRDRAAAALTEQLLRCRENDPSLNGSLVSYLLDLKAVKSAGAIERAYAAGCVDEEIVGGWEKARRELGLAGPAPPRRPQPAPPAPVPIGRGPSKPKKPAKPKKPTTPVKPGLRARRKRQRQARRRGRRRRR